MRIANAAGRLVLLDGEDVDHARAVDVATASEGRFAADPQAVYDRWLEFLAWAAVEMFDDAIPLDVTTLGPVVPAPRQVFAVGLNYRAHAEESGFALPSEPVVFTKYVSSFTGPTGDIALTAGNVDWEVELVAVIGEGGRDIPGRARLGARRRAHRRPGHLRPHHPVRRAARPVRARQVLPGLLPDRPVPGHAGRVRRSRRPANSAASSTARACRRPARAT